MEIDAYKKNMIKNDSIDMLVISHFHEDHTNGLDYMLKDRKIKVGTVVIPYFTPIDRLIIALKNKGASDWYYEFLSDPAEYITENWGNPTVIIMGGGEGANPDTGESEGPSEFNPKLKFNLEELKGDDKFKEKILGNEKNWGKYFSAGKCFAKNHNRSLKVMNYWLFRFFNYQFKEPNKVKFEKCLKEKKIDCSDNDKIREIIIDNDKRTKLSKCYKILASKDNNTSLVLYHGPININHIKDFSIYSNSSSGLNRDFNQFIYGLFYEFYPNRVGWGQLLMGDISLKNRKYKELLIHYHGLLDKVMVCLLPHHGSIENWKRDFVIRIINCHFFTASSGFNNQWKHPNNDLILEIIKNNRKFYWVNEYYDLNIRLRHE